MRKAATTWALVVGIDEYEDPNIKRLTGAANDAAAAVGWLRALGVPDGQIFLHAAPSPAATPLLDSLGMQRRGCTAPEIWKSTMQLGAQSGSRLFVFLSGHGLYEPGSKRIFLTQEATEGAMANMGIELYSDMFRSWNYPEQFLIMDGCLNQPYSAAVRSTVAAGFGTGVAPKVLRNDTTLISCFAARHGELALEEDGHGLFMSRFLAALDLTNPNPRVMDFDDTDGTIRLDVRRAILDVVSPTVTRIARDRYHRQQTPGVYPQGAGEAWPALPIVEIVPKSTATVQILVDPGTATQAVAHIRIDSDDTGWRRWEPVPPDDEVRVPIRSVVPAGTRLTVRCALRPGFDWTAPSMYVVTADSDLDFPIRLVAPPVPRPAAEEMIRVTSILASGEQFQPVTEVQYAAVRAATAGLPLGATVRMVELESGPEIFSSPADFNYASTMADVVAQVLNDATPADVNAAVISDQPLAPAAVRLRFPPGGAAVVAGFLTDNAVLTVGDDHIPLSMAAGQPIVPVHPGTVQISLRLPWGTWSEQVQVRDGQTRDVTVPAVVGIPPLRIRAAVEGWMVDRLISSSAGLISTSSTDALVLFDDTRQTSATAAEPLAGTDDGALPGGNPPPGPVRAFTVEPPPGTSRLWRTGIALSSDQGRVVLPLSPIGPIMVSLTGVMRAEPLSMQASSTWDLLVSAGRLDALTKADMESLTFSKWSEPILGLAGAYACLVQENYPYLDVVLGNLGDLEPELPDLAILRAARLRAENLPEDDVTPALRRLAVTHALPVFRWGVPLAVNAADRHGLHLWRDQLRVVDKATIPTSIWTMWSPPGGAPRDPIRP